MPIQTNPLEKTIKRLKKDPLSITYKDILFLTKAIEHKKIPKTIIRKTAIEILDMAEEGIFRSTAAEGVLGFFNKRSRTKRQERFWERIGKNFRESKENVTVLADGDSWFEHPFLYDIIDHLNRKDDVAVFSLAYGGDWLDNILFQGEYIDMLTIIKPDVFLVSGGGNDLLGDKKIGIFAKGIEPEMAEFEPKIQSARNYVHTNEIPNRFDSGYSSDEDEKDIKEGVKYLTTEFFGFVNIMQWQYCFLFRAIRNKYETLPILTQGYDYPMPDSTIKKDFFSGIYWYQHYLNEFMGSGKWVEVAFRDAKIYDTEIMKKALKAMIHIFNAMLIETGKYSEHVYHIDNRGISKPHDWFDEIHVKHHKFLQVAETYYIAMKEALNHKNNPSVVKKVYVSRDTTARPTFKQAFRAFWKGTGVKTPWIIYTALLLAGILLGIVYYFMPETAINLLVISLAFIVIRFVFKLMRAIMLSRHFSKD